MAITFSCEDIKFNLKEKLKVKRWITNIIKSDGKRVGDIGYLFCSDEYLIQVNREYLDHDTYTDIITFDYVEGNLVSGDILISIDRIVENSQKFDVSFDQELHRVIIHGILHLLGQADKSETDAAVMRSKEDAALASWNSID